MNKTPGSMPSYHGPPPAAPPSYSQAMGGVPPSSPFTPGMPDVYVEDEMSEGMVRKWVRNIMAVTVEQMCMMRIGVVGLLSSPMIW
ncbi:hypothetical protein J6590_037400 [Homalodisca vitripennis]|nr:hypothetical protein J6590_037400 [Homalodisca vitripennis]